MYDALKFVVYFLRFDIKESCWNNTIFFSTVLIKTSMIYEQFSSAGAKLHFSSSYSEHEKKFMIINGFNLSFKVLNRLRLSVFIASYLFVVLNAPACLSVFITNSCESRSVPSNWGLFWDFTERRGDTRGGNEAKCVERRMPRQGFMSFQGSLRQVSWK